MGKTITVAASYTDGHSTAESVTSVATAAVGNVNDAPVGVPTITGTATQNQTLSAVTSGISDADGIPGSFSYQWKANGVDIGGATASTYVLTQAEVGKTMTVVASYTDGHGSAESVTSAATTSVVNVNDVPTIPAGPTFSATQITITASDVDIGDSIGLYYGGFSLGTLTNGSSTSINLPAPPTNARSGALYVQDANVGQTQTGYMLYVGTNNSDSPTGSSATLPYVIYGMGGTDTIIGSSFADIFFGGAGNDTLTGGAGNDTFNVDSGTDTISDLTTGDILVVSSGATATANSITAFVATASTTNAGTATLNAASAGGSIDVSLAGGANGFALVGGSGNDTLVGSAQADTLTGGIGADTLSGGSGNDTLTGGTGADSMTGGAGADTFIVNTGNSLGTTGGTLNGGTISGYDSIIDFDTTSDILNLQGTAAAATASGDINGTNSTLTAHLASSGTDTVSHHTISNGIITFLGGSSAALALSTINDVAACVQYLQANNLGGAGATVAFTVTIGGTVHTYVYEQVGTTQSAANDILVDLVGVTVTNLSGLITGGHVG